MCTGRRRIRDERWDWGARAARLFAALACFAPPFMRMAFQIRMYSRVGRRMPLYCTAIGKVLLAYMTAEEREAALKGVKYREVPSAHGARGVERTQSRLP